MTRYRYHSACKLFPELSETALQELADDIKERGLLNPIVLLDGQILDGRNRHRACKLVGVKPRFVDWDGEGDPIPWVISQNLFRRHLTSSQRAVVALDLLPVLEAEAKKRQRLSPGRGKKVGQKCPTSSANGTATQIAARITKSNATYIKALKTISNTAPGLIDKIRSGRLKVPEAIEIAKATNGSYVFQAGDANNTRPTNTATPPGICRFLHDIISQKYKAKTILDPCAGRGALTRPWKGCKVLAFEASKGKDFFECPDRINCDLVLCNPPWSGGSKSPMTMFLERILEVVPKRTPIVMIVHWGFRLDQDKKSARWRWLRDECPPISSIITLPHDIWDDAKVHSEILLFNMAKLKSHYFLPDEYLRRRR